MTCVPISAEMPRSLWGLVLGLTGTAPPLRQDPFAGKCGTLPCLFQAIGLRASWRIQARGGIRYLRGYEGACPLTVTQRVGSLLAEHRPVGGGGHGNDAGRVAGCVHDDGRLSITDTGIRLDQPIN